MTSTKPLKHVCVCGRGFGTSSGARHHYPVCAIEQARSAAYLECVQRLASPDEFQAAQAAAIRRALAAQGAQR